MNNYSEDQKDSYKKACDAQSELLNQELTPVVLKQLAILSSIIKTFTSTVNGERNSAGISLGIIREFAVDKDEMRRLIRANIPDYVKE